MTHRSNLSTLTDAERHTLASFIKQFLTQEVISAHRNVDHMHRFFSHHRAYIFGLETFLKRNVTNQTLLRKVVPLPFWDARTPLPSHFKTFDGGPAVAPNARTGPTALPSKPQMPKKPPLGSSQAKLKAFAKAVTNYPNDLLNWTGEVKNWLLLNAPVTDTNFLNTAYPGKPFPTSSGLDHPESFEDAHDLCEAHPNGKGLGMDITEGLFKTATHYHGITHSSLAGLDTPVEVDDLIHYLATGGPRVSRPFTIGPFMNGGNTAAPFIFWPLHAFFDTLYYTWEQEHLRPIQSPAVEINPGKGNNLELFELGKDGLIWHLCHAGDDGPNTDNRSFGNWEHWHHIGGDRRLLRLAVTRSSAGEIDLFGITRDAHQFVGHVRMQGSNCEQWGPWENLGAYNKEISVITTHQDAIELFAIQADDAIWHKRKSGSASWTIWDKLFDGGQKRVTSILDGNTSNARIHVFSLSVNGYIWHRWEVAAGGDWFGISEYITVNFSKKFTDLKVARNSDNRLEIFAIGVDKKLYHAWQFTSGANNNFSAWTLLDSTPCHDLAVGRNADGRLEVFFCSGASVFHKWQDSANSGWVENADEIPLDAPMGSFRQPFTANDPAGRLTVFGVAGDGMIWHAWQTAPNQGPWIGWLPI